VAEAVLKRKQISLTTLLPAIALLVFLTMVVVGESQVRSSPHWPPPARHEIGAWEIENPAILDWAAGLDLPASVPMLALWLNTYTLEYALDDHELWVYLPWGFLVWCSWYFVACHVEHFIDAGAWRSIQQRNLVLFGQTLLTVEMVFVLMTTRPTLQTAQDRAAVAFISLWSMLTLFGWVNLIVKRRAAKRPNFPPAPATPPTPAGPL